MKKLYYIIALLGFLGLIFAAGASDTSADLLYAVPAALIAIGLMYYGIYNAVKINQVEQWKVQRILSNRAVYRIGLRKAANKK